MIFYYRTILRLKFTDIVDNNEEIIERKKNQGNTQSEIVEERTGLSKNTGCKLLMFIASRLNIPDLRRHGEKGRPPWKQCSFLPIPFGCSGNNGGLDQ